MDDLELRLRYWLHDRRAKKKAPVKPDNNVAVRGGLQLTAKQLKSVRGLVKVKLSVYTHLKIFTDSVCWDCFMTVE